MAYVLKRWGARPQFQFYVWVDQGENLLQTFAADNITTFALEVVQRF